MQPTVFLFSASAVSLQALPSESALRLFQSIRRRSPPRASVAESSHFNSGRLLGASSFSSTFSLVLPTTTEVSKTSNRVPQLSVFPGAFKPSLVPYCSPVSSSFPALLVGLRQRIAGKRRSKSLPIFTAVAISTTQRFWLSIKKSRTLYDSSESRQRLALAHSSSLASSSASFSACLFRCGVSFVA